MTDCYRDKFYTRLVRSLLKMLSCAERGLAASSPHSDGLRAIIKQGIAEAEGALQELSPGAENKTVR